MQKTFAKNFEITEVGVNIGNQSGSIVLDGCKRCVAASVAIQDRQNHMVIVLQKRCHLPVIPPGQTAAMEQKERIFILFSKLEYCHSITPDERRTFFITIITCNASSGFGRIPSFCEMCLHFTMGASKMPWPFS